jgi:hypothetical protein
LGALGGALLVLNVSVAATLGVALALAVGLAASAGALSRSQAAWTKS